MQAVICCTSDKKVGLGSPMRIKVGCVFPMVISSEFRIEQNRDDDHREDAPHFTK